MKHVNWFVVAALIFITTAIAVTLYPGEQPRGYVNTPIGLAIVCTVLIVKQEVTELRREIATNNVLLRSILDEIR